MEVNPETILIRVHLLITSFFDNLYLEIILR